MLIDSHCHLDMLPLDRHDGLDGVLRQAHAAGVERMLCISVQLEQFNAMAALCEGHDNIDLSAGVHPCYLDAAAPSLDALRPMVNDPRVVAIGETGLDYVHATNAIDQAEQQQRFRCQIAAAREFRLPLIIHMREAATDTLRLLKEESADEVGGVMHCYTSDWPTAEQAMELGFYISFSGIVTFKAASELREVARKVPEARLLVETDAPYLAPVPFRGKSNHPALVHHTAARVAQEREVSLEHLAAVTTDNYYRLFGNRSVTTNSTDAGGDSPSPA